jgi:hypothetical protein
MRIDNAAPPPIQTIADSTCATLRTPYQFIHASGPTRVILHV